MSGPNAYIPIVNTAFDGNLARQNIASLEDLAQATDNLPLGIPDSASDDIYYGRRNGAWFNLKTYFDTLYSVLGHTHAYLSDAASDGLYYGRRNGAWTNLKTYFDGLYAALAHAGTHAAGGADELGLLVADADSNVGAISTTGETTILTFTIPGGTLSARHYAFQCYMLVNTDTNARTLTIRYKTGGATNTRTISLAASKLYRGLIQGAFSYNGVNNQAVDFSERVHNQTDGTFISDVVRTASQTELDANPITFTITMQLSGSITSSVVRGASALGIKDI